MDDGWWIVDDGRSHDGVLSLIQQSKNPFILFMLALALFVAGVGADHANDALAPDNFTIFAKFFD